MSCRQQTGPPPCDAVKMSPRINIGPEPVLAAHAPSPPAVDSHTRPEETQLPIVEQNSLSFHTDSGGNGRTALFPPMSPGGG